MNGYGDMLTGQIVSAYFYPVPEPSSLALAPRRRRRRCVVSPKTRPAQMARAPLAL